MAIALVNALKKRISDRESVLMSTINVLSRQELQNSNNADLTPIIETLTTLAEKLHLVPGTDEISIADKVPPKELTIAERLTDVLKSVIIYRILQLMTI